MALLFYVTHIDFSLFFSLFLQHAPGARRAPSRGWWPCYFILFIFILFHVYNTNQVLVGLPQGVGGLPILFYLFISFHLF
jgi:hypothetical protein